MTEAGKIAEHAGTAAPAAPAPSAANQENPANQGSQDSQAQFQSGSEILTISGVRYSYPSGLQALGGLDLQLGLGEVVAVVGPSGCGKSTLLSLIADLAPPSGGTISWDEARLGQADRGGRRLSMLFQRDTVLPWRTVEKNIRFGMESMSMPKNEQREWTDTLLKLGNLEDFRKAYPRTLSGGMRRRLGLLMSLAVRPAVLLLDEPFSALDEPTRVELASDVLKLAYTYKVSVLLVTHDLGEAISIADRIVVLTNRPARVQRVFDVGFGHDRDVVALRETPEYADLYGELWHELWTTIRRGQ
jgi:NitT/TauT family transport system ATP-binding protein